MAQTHHNHARLSKTYNFEFSSPNLEFPLPKIVMLYLFFLPNTNSLSAPTISLRYSLNTLLSKGTITRLQIGIHRTRTKVLSHNKVLSS